MGCKASKKEENSQLKEFAGNTSLHGVRYLAERSIIRRLFWFAALAAAFGVCGNQVSKTVLAFMAKPFSTTVTVERNETQLKYFPAVTICNLNKVSMRQYVITSRKYDSQENINITDEQLRQRILVYMALMTYKGDGSSKTLEAARKEMFSEPGFQERGPILGNYLQGLGHTLKGMLSFYWLSPCKFRGEKCTASNFTSLVNLNNGRCYTFNSGSDGHPLLEIPQIPGPTQGLRLKLNVEEEDHVVDFNAPMSGFKVLIHDQNEYPLIEDFGFAIQPGTHTFAAVSVTKFKNLASPFKTDCRSPEIPFTKYFKYPYSQQACIKQCLHDHMIEKCKCQPLYNITPGVELCSVKDAFDCVYPLMHNKLPQSVANCAKNCPRPCNMTRYDTKLSYASAMSSSFARTVPAYSTIIDPEYQKELQKSTPEDLQKFLTNNLVSLDIYFEDLSYTFIEQKPVFDTWALFANLGGYTGLFLGMSALTVLEFFDFLVVWCITKIGKSSKESQVANDDKDKNEFQELDQPSNLSTPFSKSTEIFNMNEK